MKNTTKMSLGLGVLGLLITGCAGTLSTQETFNLAGEKVAKDAIKYCNDERISKDKNCHLNYSDGVFNAYGKIDNPNAYDYNEILYGKIDNPKGIILQFIHKDLNKKTDASMITIVLSKNNETCKKSITSWNHSKEGKVETVELWRNICATLKDDHVAVKIKGNYISDFTQSENKTEVNMKDYVFKDKVYFYNAYHHIGSSFDYDFNGRELKNIESRDWSAKVY